MKQHITVLLFRAGRPIKSFMAMALLVGLGLLFGCTGRQEKPDPESEIYRRAVGDFYISLAAIQSDQALFAIDKMNAVKEQFPREPAVWANLGVFSMRQGNFEQAEEQLNRALDLDPDNPQLEFLLGIMYSRSGQIGSAVKHLKRSAELNPNDVKVQFALAEELLREDAQSNANLVKEILEGLMEKRPENLSVLMEIARSASVINNRTLFEKSIDRLQELSGRWPESVRRQFREIQESLDQKSLQNLTFELAFLRNNLAQLPGFQADQNEVKFPPNQIGFLTYEFKWLPQPTVAAAIPDTAMGFTVSFSESALQRPYRVSTISPTGDEAARLVVLNATGLQVGNQRLELPRSSTDRGYQGSAIPIDLNNDFMMDLALVGQRGLAFYRLQADTTYREATASLSLPEPILNRSYRNGWAADLDLEGDLDLILSGDSGEPLVLRNNGDGTLSPVTMFEGISNPVDFVWADLDADGDPDAIFLDKGSVQIQKNQRAAGSFEASGDPLGGGSILDITAADLDGDSYFELLALHADSITAFRFDRRRETWRSSKLIDFDEPVGFAENGVVLFEAPDLDNNGSLDLIISDGRSTHYWLSDARGLFSHPAEKLDAGVWAVEDMDGDLRLDLTGTDSEGTIQILYNRGDKNYGARMIRPRASGLTGDQRINSFGIGGEIEIRSGLLYQKQRITSPLVHVGLGRYEEAEMLRVIWPNGSVQAEFAELGYGNKIINEQILKGSCPWLFAYDGKGMEFVTDLLWRTALGLRINAQGAAGVIHSIDWVKVGAEQLVPRDGYYDLRITAELWETHFFDHVRLMAVDHPTGSEIFVDERFTLPAPDPELIAVSYPEPVSLAWDQDGRDVTGLVRERDGRYLDTFALGDYQGVAEPHHVEIDLSGNKLSSKAVWLVASGWIYPTDSSINIAISQGSQEPPKAIQLQVPDGDGGWVTARENIGFPAGKNKTMMIRLDDLIERYKTRRFRLSTNMEIYWDRLAIANGRSKSKLVTTEIDPQVAELRYRGYSEMKRPSRRKPEIPVYDKIATTEPLWRDLVGFYTRFGDVKELIAGIDDRYVIMNAGDELLLRFPVPDPPKEGWTRDFIMISDGWVKDGDYNTGFSETVIPLPYHGMTDYSEFPGSLSEDPVYKRQRADWARFHTRYIDPVPFQEAWIFSSER
ncbi:MAG: FG-GAP-like repeat-containing protein [Balneolaceae bacterium]|nr:FG-GAP-like repeat-containing protein [Balneolaceae bacterium]